MALYLSKIFFQTASAPTVAKEVLIIEGVRQNWKPNPVKVIDYNLDFLSSLKLEKPLLANAFIIKNIPYYWKKGKIEPWK